MDEHPRVPVEFDRCLRRTRSGLPCGKFSHHVGACAPEVEIVEEYREYAAHVRRMAQGMKRVELERAAEFHLLAWKILRDEFNGR